MTAHVDPINKCHPGPRAGIHLYREVPGTTVQGWITGLEARHATCGPPVMTRGGVMGIEAVTPDGRLRPSRDLQLRCGFRSRTALRAFAHGRLAIRCLSLRSNAICNTSSPLSANALASGMTQVKRAASSVVTLGLEPRVHLYRKVPGTTVQGWITGLEARHATCGPPVMTRGGVATSGMTRVWRF